MRLGRIRIQRPVHIHQQHRPHPTHLPSYQGTLPANAATTQRNIRLADVTDTTHSRLANGPTALAPSRHGQAIARTRHNRRPNQVGSVAAPA
jgi:hypothetical protein